MSPEPLADFRLRAHAAACIVGADGRAFGFADLAGEMGSEFMVAGKAKERLRGWLEREDGTNDPDVGDLLTGAIRARKGLLWKLDRDLWRLDAEPAHDPDSAVRVADAMRRLGGICSHADLCVEADATTESARRAVSTILSTSDAYTNTTPVDGHRGWWRQRDRSESPVPGRLLHLDLRLTTARRTRLTDMAQVVESRLCRIGLAVREARASKGFTVAHMVTGAAGAAMDRALADATWSVAQGHRAVPLSEWWRDLLDEHGARVAMAVAWSDLESGAGVPVAFGLDVAFYDSVGSELGVSPARLSRGAL